MRINHVTILWLLPLWLAVSPAAAAGDSSAGDRFEAHAVYLSGPYWNTSLQALRIADVNDDGLTDIIGAIGLGQSITVLLGEGNGIFGPPENFPEVDLHARDIAVADLNGDGRLDIAVACALDPLPEGRGPDGAVAILLGRGDGTFVAPALFEAGTGPVAIRAGDLDGDGDTDLVVANGESDDVAVLRNLGGGQFRLTQSYSAGSAPTALELGDFEGDGDLDLVVVSRWDDSAAILLGTGDGRFLRGPIYETGDYPRGISVSDFDGDGRPDIAVAAYNGEELAVFLGLGGGFFERVSTVPVRSRHVRSADFDLDGHADLVCTGRSRSMFIYRGRGDGSFEQSQELRNGGVDPLCMATGDLNGDGRPDLLLGAYSTHVAVMLNQGRGTFFDARWYNPTGGYHQAVALGDVNSDGIPDIAVAASNPTSFLVSLGLGDGTFDVPHQWGMYYLTRSIHIIDLDGDGNRDLLATFRYYSHGGFSFRLGNGGGYFGELTVYDESEYVENSAVGDLDGDGDADIILVDAADDLVIVYLNGDGATFERLGSFPVGENPGQAALGDLDRDGNLDLAVANRDSENISILLGNGDGSFGPAVNYASAQVCWDLGFADLTGDGRLDLVAACSGLGIYPGRGDGTLRTPLWYDEAYGATVLAVGDVNKDGRIDVVLGNGLKKAVSLVPGGQMRSPVDYLAQNNITGIALADLNRDEHLDVVLCEWDGIHVLLNNARRFSTVTADLNCVPAAGTLPFSCRFRCRLRNHWHGKRRMHARLEAQLADGTLFENWRSSEIVLDDVEERTYSWVQDLPALQKLAGQNVFRIQATDISPAPFNQPPYPASGWTGNAECVVEGALASH